MGQACPMSMNDRIIVPVLSNIAVIALFLIPLICMRLFAEEKRQGTIELLITSPVHDLEIILGKWLSAVLMYAALLVLLFADFAFLFIYGNPDWKPVALGFLGLLLQGASILSLCTFISTLTKNQIVAAAIGFRAVADSVCSQLGYRVRQLSYFASALLHLDREPL